MKGDFIMYMIVYFNRHIFYIYIYIYKYIYMKRIKTTLYLIILSANLFKK